MQTTSNPRTRQQKHHKSGFRKPRRADGGDRLGVCSTCPSSPPPPSHIKVRPARSFYLFILHSLNNLNSSLFSGPPSVLSPPLRPRSSVTSGLVSHNTLPLPSPFSRWLARPPLSTVRESIQRAPSHTLVVPDLCSPTVPHRPSHRSHPHTDRGGEDEM